MAKITPISGFPEWLPEQKILEDKIVNTIRAIYEAHGYTPIETRSVEHMSILASKGDINKEIYVIQRAHADQLEVSEETLALHFDLTIPFARYVAQNFNVLSFPFKRYQLQRSWRGERPQEGRFREFYQFDIDVVTPEELPLCHDAEMISIIAKSFQKLGLGKFQIKTNNRKLLLGMYEHFGLNLEQRQAAVIIIDKIDKIGPAAVKAELGKEGISANIADEIIKISGLKLKPSEFEKTAAGLGPKNESFMAGLREIKEVLSLVTESALPNVVVDLSLARGLDYYTGTIIETILTDYPSFGSVAGGGRYENLTERFGSKNIPGVGISIGITRLMSLVISKGLLQADQYCPTKILVALNSAEDLKRSLSLAEELRASGLNTEVFHKPLKFGKQIEYADKKGIRFVLFLNDAGTLELKDIKTKEQQPITVAELVIKLS